MKLSIGENIRRYRQEKGMTQESLAEAIGVSFQAVSRWETGCAYPDIEMIPRIARFFSVSADTLLGIDAASAEERKNEYRLAIRRLQEEGKMEKALALSKEALREFPHDWYLLADFCDFLREEIYQGKTEYLSELRRNCNKIWEHCTDHDLQMKAIELMVCAAQDEEEVEEWIRKSQFGKSAYELRLARYEFREDPEAREQVKERMNLNSIRSVCFNMRPLWCRSASSVQGNRIALQLLDVVSEKNGSDAFLWDYAFFNTRLCAGLFDSGEVEEGYRVMESVVEMLERWFAIPDGTEIPYDCYCFQNLTYTKTPRRFDFFERRQGWEWFDCVRDEERYKALAARVAKCNQTAGKNG